MKISKKGKCKFCNSKTNSIVEFLVINLGKQFKLCPFHTGCFRVFLIRARFELINTAPLLVNNG